MSTTEVVIAEIRTLVAAHFGDTFAPEDIRVDADVFEGGEPLVAGRSFDSLDLVEVLALIEEHFDVELATVLSGDQPLTLATVASDIADRQPAGQR